MCVHIQRALLYTCRQRGIQTLRQPFGNNKLPRYFFELHVCLECLHGSRIYDVDHEVSNLSVWGRKVDVLSAIASRMRWSLPILAHYRRSWGICPLVACTSWTLDRMRRMVEYEKLLCHRSLKRWVCSEHRLRKPHTIVPRFSNFTRGTGRHRCTRQEW